MSRGGGWLTGGILLVVGGLCGGAVLRSVAISTLKNSRGFDEAVQQMNTLGFFGTILNLALLGGIIAVIVGIVLLVVDGGRQDYYPPPQPDRPSSPTPSAAEEENRRLREEVARLRREQAGTSDTAPGPLDALFGDALRQRQQRDGGEGKPSEGGGPSGEPGAAPDRGGM